MQIIPAILSDDPNEVKILLQQAETAHVDRVQVDIIDDKFTDNITVSPDTLKEYQTFLNLDFHLMVKNPVEWISHCTRSLNKKDRIIGQIEYMESQRSFVERVLEDKNQAGLALDLQTPVDKLDQEILHKISVILLMSVPAGFGGQEFHLDVWPKIEKIVKLRKESGLNFKICVDGGITQELVHDMQKASVDEVTVGKRIFEPDLSQNLKLFNI